MAQHTPPAAQHAYVVQPPSVTNQGVLVLHAWWGLNPSVRRFCDRLAGQGFWVLAPDLYHGALATTTAEAQKLRSRLKGRVVQQEIAAASAQLQAFCAGHPIGLVGFSLGGYWALWWAQVSPGVAATTIFYATRGGDYSASCSVFQFHLAERDDFVAASGVKKLQKALQAAGRDATFYTYPGTVHGFCEDDSPNACHAQAAELAWGRMVEFLHQYLGASENPC